MIEKIIGFVMLVLAAVCFAVPTFASTVPPDQPADQVVSPASVDAVPEDPEQQQTFQQALLDKLDVIILLLALVFATGLFQLIALIVKLFGWIFTNIFKEIL